MKHYTTSTLALLVITAVSGCSSALIGEKEGSTQVNLKTINQVSNCQSKGKVNVSVLAKLGFLPRKEEDIEDNLDQLGRNNAIENDADTLVRGESKELGKRQY